MNKKILSVVTLSLLLSGCSFSKKPSTENSGGNSDSILSNANGSNEDKTSNSTVIDESVYDANAYQKVTMTPFSIEKRTIASIDDVTYEDFFNINNKVNISIDISQEELQKLDDDYKTGLKTEKYRHARKVTISLTNEGNTYKWEFDDVGIRQKGNTSRGPVLDQDGVRDFHIKLSFDETFDDAEIYSEEERTVWADDIERQARKDRNLLGLSGLDSKRNLNCDETYVKQIYSSMLYRACGIMAQNITLGEISLTNTTDNKTYTFGLYDVYEPINKSFIKRSLKKGYVTNMPSWTEEKNGAYGVIGSSYGDLYKCSYGNGSMGYGRGANLTKESIKGRIGVNTPDGANIPVYNLKTNKDLTDNSLLENTINVLSNKSYNEIASYVDLDEVAIREAINFVIGDPDDSRNNSNNYYIYMRRTDGKMIIIPADFDRCFGSGGNTWKPEPSNMAATDMFSLTAYGSGNDISNPLYLKTILATQANYSKAVYLNQIKAIKSNGWLNDTYIKQLYNVAKQNYGDKYYFSFDSTTHSSNSTFNEYAREKSNHIDLNKTITNQGGNNTNVDSVISSNINNSTVDNSSTISYGDEAPYKNLYLAGYKNQWTTKEYPMIYKGNGIYELEISNVELYNDGELKFKFNNGADWNELNWGRKSGTNNSLQLNGGENFQVTGIPAGANIVIRIDLNTMLVNVDII